MKTLCSGIENEHVVCEILVVPVSRRTNCPLQAYQCNSFRGTDILLLTVNRSVTRV